MKQLTDLSPLPRVCAPSNATASFQLNPIRDRNTLSTSEHRLGIGRRSPDPGQDVLSFRPQRNEAFIFNTFPTDVCRITAFAEATQKSALEICEYFVRCNSNNGWPGLQISDNPPLLP